ncbi:MAG TPA: SDR family NAD(P)-dependent oxidoreductase [Saprospiraceae bacterium]|nr:SDR family NAD(P)-dependent oxidoreductase [Saprospiraceae bacterium]HMQ81260.1 SDR family NAD(P)-dependent oxidoreductase [Saprospiraceae bacterium]
MPENRTSYALITGSSHGIGRAMAEECARRGIPVLLVALDEPELHRFTKYLSSTYNVATDCLGINLLEGNSPDRVHAWCKEKGYEVGILINNAGFGRSGLFNNVALEEYYNMILLNNRAMIGLTYRFLPDLLQLPKAHILNMSSMEATLPLPYKAVYTGTKHFVYGISLALREELKTTGIKVSVLCPGPTVTNEDGLRRIQSQGKKAKLLVSMPEDVAKEAVAKMLKGQRVIIPGFMPYLIVQIMNRMPLGWKMSILERMFRAYR